MISCEFRKNGPYTSAKNRMIFRFSPSSAGRATYVSMPAIFSVVPRAVPECSTVLTQQSPGARAIVAISAEVVSVRLLIFRGGARDTLCPMSSEASADIYSGGTGLKCIRQTYGSRVHILAPCLSEFMARYQVVQCSS